ncbi:MAG: MlrC C-terminal domain-containing protein, partial [Anaerolineaceae bacterium]|nr:MlrC C-terminal domain-containing protein [Anaerolineaceae bacterium]
AGHQPLHGRFEVVKLSDGDFPCTGPMMKGFTQNLGKMAQLRVDGVHIIVSSVRTQPLDQSYFRRVGIEPGEMNILVLKSSNHYRADFGPLSSEIINVSSPGGLIDDPSRAKYVNLREGVRLCGLGPVQKKASS